MPVFWILGTRAPSKEGLERVQAYCKLHGLRKVGTLHGGAERLEEAKFDANGVVVVTISDLGTTASGICAFADEAACLSLDVFSLDDSIHTGSAQGRLVFNVMSVLGKWEREVREELREAAS
jgi:DNA invertase Pin-like site-specific DNA recombinase